MGIDLTKQLFSRHAATLTAGELVVMGYMCLVALDKENAKGQPARLYFAGWEPLALALGYDDLTDAAKTKVKRAIKGLRDRGLIKPLVGHAQIGERQVYRIQVGLSGGLDVTPSRGSEVDPHVGVRNRPKRGSESDPPRKDLGGDEDLSEDIQLIPLPQVTGQLRVVQGGSK